MNSRNQLMKSKVNVFRMFVAVAFLLSMGKAGLVHAEDLPELAITTVALIPPAPNPGQAFDINISIENSGLATTPGVVYRDVYINNDPTVFVTPEGCVPTAANGGIDSDYFRDSDNAQIAAGATDTRAVSLPDGLPAGVYQIWIYADASCGELESNEANNAYGPINITIGTQLILKSQSTSDGWILETTETSGNGGVINSGATTLRIGDDGANKQYRSILSFDTSVIPDDAIVTIATLRIKYAGKVGGLPFTTHGKLFADIRKGPFSNNPVMQTSDFKAPGSKNKVFSFTSTKVDNWYSKGVNPAYLNYINLTDITQFRLYFSIDDNNDLGADFLKIHSGNGNPGVQPQLIIWYYIPE
jgi:hypothetical protein